MTAKEKAIQIIEKINNKPISLKEWNTCSEYARIDLKRKANIVVDEVLIVICAIDGTEHFQQFYEEVKTELEKL